MRRTLPRLLLCAGAVLAVAAFQPSAATAQQVPPDLSGTYTLTATASLPNDGGTCTYSGTIVVTQNANGVFGTPTLFKQDGPLACPPLMTAELTGGFEGDMLVLGLMLGPLGEAEFSALLGPVDARSRVAEEAQLILDGTWTVTEGPFTGGGGTWAAAPAAFSLTIPTLSWVGLAALAVLLLLIGAWLVHRKGPAAVS